MRFYAFIKHGCRNGKAIYYRVKTQMIDLLKIDKFLLADILVDFTDKSYPGMAFLKEQKVIKFKHFF